ncbi:hypothetical protein AB4865_08890 [Capnocytophaga sp. ARDL2]|uniref:hypothetical protein n=1 Tax=Capnocytophaga sp. ARDL2 TaxID=3238809 RepID=UPI003556AD3D
MRKRGHLEKGIHGVRIEIRKHESEVLLSDFDFWHYPISYQSYISDGEKDCELYEKS